MEETKRDRQKHTGKSMPKADRMAGPIHFVEHEFAAF
jgi:hypothetical protein